MFKHHRKPIAVILLLLLFCVASFPDVPVAATAQEQEKIELVELRDSSSKTYYVSEGTYEWVGYAEDVHYLDENGDYQEIDNSILSESIRLDNVDYAYKNGANDYTVRCASDAAEKHIITMEYQGKSLSFGLADGAAVEGTKTKTLDNEILADMAYAENCVQYKNVYPGIDLVYETKTHGIKEYIVLNQPTEQNEFYFNVSFAGLTPKETEGNVAFLDETGETVFETKQLYAIDDSGEERQDVKCAIVKKEDSYQLKITLDAAYLSDAKRAFPVVIDPSVMITGSSVTYDSFVSSRYPNTNYYLNTYIRTGRDADYYTRRTYIKFTLPTNIPADYVTSAYLRVKEWTGLSPAVKAYRVTDGWTSSTVTWNNRPDYSTVYASGNAYNDSGSWWRMFATTLVKKWLDGTYTNHGFLLRDETESGTMQWTTFYSSDAPSPNKPELHIVYEQPVEITAVWPSSGYLLQDETYTIKAWVSGGSTPSVTFRYPADGTIKLSANLTDAGTYYSADITPDNTSCTAGVYSNGNWVSHGRLFSATASGNTDTYPSSIFICIESNDYYSNSDSTFTYSSPSNNSFRGVGTAVYNCAAYAVDVTTEAFYFGINPTEAELYDFMTKTGAYSNRAGTQYTEPCNANEHPSVIYYSDSSWGQGRDGHFGKVQSWDANGYATSIISKWGEVELLYSSSADPFIGVCYGGPKAYYK